MLRDLAPGFRLVKDASIGLLVPPSFVRGVPAGLLEWFGRIDQRIDTARITRGLGDHRLMIFVRS